MRTFQWLKSKHTTKRVCLLVVCCSGEAGYGR
jgi:hypothetical protein